EPPPPLPQVPAVCRPCLNLIGPPLGNRQIDASGLRGAAACKCSASKHKPACPVHGEALTAGAARRTRNQAAYSAGTKNTVSKQAERRADQAEGRGGENEQRSLHAVQLHHQQQ